MSERGSSSPGVCEAIAPGLSSQAGEVSSQAGPPSPMEGLAGNASARGVREAIAPGLSSQAGPPSPAGNASVRGVCEAMAPSLSSQTGPPSPAEGLAGNASAREVVAPSPAEGPVEAAQASGEGGPSSSSTVPPTVFGALHCGCCGYAQPDADETCEFCGCGQLCDDCAWRSSLWLLWLRPGRCR